MGSDERVEELEAAEQGRESGEDQPDAESRGGRWPVERLKPVLEAMIFAVADPLPARRVCDAVAGVAVSEVRAAAEALRDEYAERGIRLVEVAGGWQFRTAPEHHGVVRALFKDRPLRLTRAAIETVAVIAYKQPVTRAEIEAVRGVDSSGVLESLVERRVVRIAGRRDVPGRPLVYTTTPYFLELFGLKDLKSLPTLAELGDEMAGLAERSEFASVGDPDAAVVPLDEEGGGVDQENDSPAEETPTKVRFGPGIEGEDAEPEKARHHSQSRPGSTLDD